MEDIRRRSRLESPSERLEQQVRQRRLRLNLAFLGACALVVVLCVTGVLLVEKQRVSAKERQLNALLEGVERSYEEALELAEGDPPRREEALRRLERIIKDYPSTETAEKARQSRQTILWEHLEAKLQEINEMESHSAYQRALEVYDSLASLSSEPLFRGIVNQQRTFTSRLARNQGGTSEPSETAPSDGQGGAGSSGDAQ